MIVALEQVFYGRGEFGYAVLGSSSGGFRFEQAVESLCGSMGNPNSPLPEPFLISKPAGDHVVMVCVCNGRPDTNGRGTVFCHALIGAKDDLAAATLDAFKVFEQGLFKSEMNRQPLKALSVTVEEEHRQQPTANAEAAKTPIVLKAKAPNPTAIRLLLGGRTLDLAWATFAFQEMSGFDIYALSANAFEILKEVEVQKADRGQNATAQKSSRMPFFFAFALDIVLVVCCICLLSKSPMSAKTGVDEPGKDFVRRSDVLNELKEQFNKELQDRSEDEVGQYFREAMEGTRYADFQEWRLNSNEIRKINLVDGYIRFVKNRILDNQTEGE